jgi:predicted XRE-type DNA-binding protein
MSDRRYTLTDDDADDIRLMYATGTYRQVDLAEQFGVTQPQISKIVNNKQRKPKT